MTKKDKTKRMKNVIYRGEDHEDIIKFIWILLILIVILIGVYFFSRIFVTKDLLNKNKTIETITPGEINYDITLIGSMLNKPEEEYYVLIYNNKSTSSVYYSGLVSTYNRNKDHLKVYIADLNNELNKKYYDKDNINNKTNDLNTFKVGDLTLVKISKNKIVDTKTTEEDIASELKYVKDTQS